MVLTDCAISIIDDCLDLYTVVIQKHVSIRYLIDWETGDSSVMHFDGSELQWVQTESSFDLGYWD